MINGKVNYLLATTAILIGSFVLFNLIRNQQGFIKIEDVSQPQVIEYNTNGKRVVTSILTIKGEVDGDFTINGIYKFEEGKVDREIRSDWYSNEISIDYDPDGVTKGNLKIKVTLLSL